MAEDSVSQPQSNNLVDNGPEFKNSDSIFNQLGEMFSQATLPTKEETYGWWSGRCYDKSSPNNPRAHLLVSRSLVIRDSADHGPSFPSKPDEIKHQMIFLERPGKPVNYYDNNLSRFQKAVEEELEGKEGKQIIAVEENGSLSSRYDEGNLKYSIRKYQDYFIGQATLLRNDENGRAGDVHYNCHAFEQVYSY